MDEPRPACAAVEERQMLCSTEVGGGQHDVSGCKVRGRDTQRVQQRFVQATNSRRRGAATPGAARASDSVEKMFVTYPSRAECLVAMPFSIAFLAEQHHRALRRRW